MWRRLQKIGAAAVKNGVYALPRSEQSLEDFEWVAREVAEGGGDASVCEASFVQGLTNEEIVELFQASRQEDYLQVLAEIERLRAEIDGAAGGDGRAKGLTAKIARIRQRHQEIAAIDFFQSPKRKQVEAALTQIEASVRDSSRRRARAASSRRSGRTWVTRKGVHVDRIASAWLIRRFIDPKARFKFVAAKGYRPQDGEIRYDMFDAEHTHEGDMCTFEVLASRFNVTDKGLKPIAEIVHDIDLKESKFGRAETAGMALVINSICRAHQRDMERIEKGSAVLDDLYAFFKG